MSIAVTISTLTRLTARLSEAEELLDSHGSKNEIERIDRLADDLEDKVESCIDSASNSEEDETEIEDEDESDEDEEDSST
jgi:hypothetical protein